VGCKYKISLEISEGGAGALKVTVDQGPVAKFAQVISGQEKNAVAASKGGLEVFLGEVKQLEISQHPLKYFRGRGRIEQFRGEALVIPRNFLQEFPAVLVAEDSAEEGVDDDLFMVIANLDEEMAGKADPYARQVQSMRHFEVEDGEGDGDPSASIENRVQKAVQRIGVVFRVSFEALFMEEGTVEKLNLISHGSGACDRRANPFGERMDFIEAPHDVDLRSRLGGNPQGCLREGDLILGEGRQCFEAFSRVHARSFA